VKTWPEKVVRLIEQYAKAGDTDREIAGLLRKQVSQKVSSDDVGRIRRDVLKLKKSGGRPRKNGQGPAIRAAAVFKVAPVAAVKPVRTIAGNEELVARDHLRESLGALRRRRGQIDAELGQLRRQRTRIDSTIREENRLLKHIEFSAS
jgi:hypothetical protein